LACIERAFGDPDWERMAFSQLHALKMMTSIMPDEYMDKLEMLVGRTAFNKVVLGDTSI